MLKTNNDEFAGLFDSDVADVDFFAEEAAPTEGEEEVVDDKNPKVEDSKPKEEPKPDEDLFKKEEVVITEEEEEEEEEEAGEPEGEPSSALSTLKNLKEKGYIDYELEEGETLTEQKAEELIEDSFDNMFEERIEELFANVPEVVKQMNKYVLQGGDINAFLDQVATQKSTGISVGMDLTDEANQELVVRNGLKDEGYDDEYIAANIEFLKDSKRMESVAEKQYSKWTKEYKVKQAEILESTKNAEKEAKAQRRELKNKVVSFLDETETVEGFAVTRQDKKELPTYMSDRTIQLENGNQVTGMQKDLMRVLNSPTGSIQIAKLLKNANADGVLSFEEIKQHTESKVTEKVRDNVRRNKKSVISGAGGVRKSKKPLASYFN